MQRAAGRRDNSKESARESAAQRRDGHGSALHSASACKLKLVVVLFVHLGSFTLEVQRL